MSKTESSFLTTWRHLLAYWILLSSFGLGALLFNLLAGLRSLLPYGEATRRHTRTGIQWILRFYLTVLRFSRSFFLHFPTNTNSLRKVRGSLVLANHPSMLDAPILLSELPDAICYYKASMHKGICSNHGGRLAGYLTNASGVDGVRQAIEHLHRGGNVVVFPEGTRSQNRHQLNPFQPGFALIAVQAASSVLCLEISTNSNVLGKGEKLWGKPILPATYQVREIACLRAEPGERPHAFAGRVERLYACQAQLSGKHSTEGVSSS